MFACAILSETLVYKILRSLLYLHDKLSIGAKNIDKNYPQFSPNLLKYPFFSIVCHVQTDRPEEIVYTLIR